jgi:hypothetical protein
MGDGLRPRFDAVGAVLGHRTHPVADNRSFVALDRTADLG